MSDCTDAKAFKTALLARRTVIQNEIAAMTSSSLGGKPNAKTQDGGTTLDHQEYKKGLYKELEDIRKELKHADEMVKLACGEGDGSMVFEVVTENELW